MRIVKEKKKKKMMMMNDMAKNHNRDACMASMQVLSCDNNQSKCKQNYFNYMLKVEVSENIVYERTNI